MIRIDAMRDLDTDALACIGISASPEIAAQLPKGVRLNARGSAYIEFRSNGCNGGLNETGVKRVKALLKAIDKLGLPVVFAQPAHVRDELNAPFWGMSGSLLYITREGLEARLG